MTEPNEQRCRSTDISLNFTDYNDTLNVDIYYDADSVDYNGTFIQSFELINNAKVDFTWHNDELPTGEYFIYSRVSDGYNSAQLQYAQGSIWIDNLNDPGFPNDIFIYESDSLFLNCIFESSPKGYVVYYQDVSDERTYQVSKVGNELAYLYEAVPGKEYDIWVRLYGDTWNYGQESMHQRFIYTAGMNGFAPYINKLDMPELIFIENETGGYNIPIGDADDDDAVLTVESELNGLTIDGTTLIWTPQSEAKGVHRINLIASDDDGSDTLETQVIVFTQQQAEVDVKFSSPTLFEEDNMFVTVTNYRNINSSAIVHVENLQNAQSLDIECRKVNDFDYIGQFEVSFRDRTEIDITHGDTLQLTYNYDGSEYYTYAVYDSTQQNSDHLAPGVITDLSAELFEENKFELKWSAPGDDGSIGNAFAYDIRYSFTPLNTEEDYFIATKIETDIVPNLAGALETLEININSLPDAPLFDKIYIMVVTEDEMMNRSEISNRAMLSYHYMPYNFVGEVSGTEIITLTWQNAERDSSEFLYDIILRRYNENEFIFIADSIIGHSFTDNLHDTPDGSYQYQLLSVYNTGISNPIYSNIVEPNRFSNIRIDCLLSDDALPDSIHISLSGQDSLYQQIYDIYTNELGFMLFDNVFEADYQLVLSKTGYDTLAQIISVIDGQYEFAFTLNQLQSGIVIDFTSGWNWFSINVESGDMSLINVLSSLNPKPGDFIKNQNVSAEYYPEFGWYGSLETINIIDMYQLDIENGGTIEFTGYPSDPSNITIHLTDGWNWIGYIPQNAGIINDALGSIGNSGLFIKNQSASAEYYPEFDWFGGIEFMSPGEGYQLQINGEADLIYPSFEADDGLTRTKEEKVLPVSISEWVVNPHAFEFNGAITLSIDNREDSPGDYIAAFVGDECRGIAEYMDFPFDDVDKGIYILMAYSNMEVEEDITFKYYNGAEDVVIDYTESIEFTLDMVVGNGFNSFGLSREFIIPTEYSLSAAYPNPFNPTTTLSLALPIESEVFLSIYNLQGREVASLVNGNMEAGYHSVVWNADNYSSGIYFVQMIAGDYNHTQKLMLVK